VSAPVVSVAVILASVFIPMAFMGGITGRLNKQFALTIAVSVLISAFNALTLSPALSALLLAAAVQASKGLVARFFAGFNRWFARATSGYVKTSRLLIRKVGPRGRHPGRIRSLWRGSRVAAFPRASFPDEDRASSSSMSSSPTLPRWSGRTPFCRKIEAILAATPEVSSYNTVVAFRS